jgi:hypothetical protein
VGGVRTLLPFRNRPGPRRQHAPVHRPPGGRLDLPDTAPLRNEVDLRRDRLRSARPRSHLSWPRPRPGTVFGSTSTLSMTTARSCSGMSASSGLEGIVSKRKASPYRSGRSPDWLKMKNRNADSVGHPLLETNPSWAELSSIIQKIALVVQKAATLILLPRVPGCLFLDGCSLRRFGRTFRRIRG